MLAVKRKFTAVYLTAAAHYGFTDKELDFIPSTKLRASPSTKLRAGNYDIKYRTGREAEDGEDDEE